MKSIKILQLNVWSGRIKDGLSKFISEGDYDVVCLQEAIWDKNQTKFLDQFVDTVDRIKKDAGFDYDYRCANMGFRMFDEKVICEFGNVILSKIPFRETEEINIIGEYSLDKFDSDFEHIYSNQRYAALRTTLENGLNIYTYHGYYLPNPLGDETTTRCMNTLASAVKNASGPVVLCGDLNVIHEAPCMRELDFLKDLTEEHGIKTTLRNIRFTKDVACDHIMVSDDVDYSDFKTVDAPVSDHKGLIVSINI